MGSLLGNGLRERTHRRHMGCRSITQRKVSYILGMDVLRTKSPRGNYRSHDGCLPVKLKRQSVSVIIMINGVGL
jgi:hypothetical protein